MTEENTRNEQENPGTEPATESADQETLPLSFETDSPFPCEKMSPVPADTHNGTEEKDNNQTDSGGSEPNTEPEPAKATLRLTPKTQDGTPTTVIPVKAKILSLTPKKPTVKTAEPETAVAPEPVALPDNPVAQVRIKPDVPLKRGESSQTSSASPSPAPPSPTALPSRSKRPVPTAPQVPSQPTTATQAPRRPVHPQHAIDTESATVGQILRHARIQLDFSILQVEQVTRIKRLFLEALEQDDHQSLPQPVYVNAYVKTLCELYGISHEGALALLEKMRERTRTRTVSEEIIHHLEEDKQVNPDEEQRVRRYVIMAATAVLCLFVLGTILITVHLKRSKQPTPSPVASESQAPAAVAVTVSAPLPKNFGKELSSPRFMTMTELDLRE
jgi:hypothetical protein